MPEEEEVTRADELSAAFDEIEGTEDNNEPAPKEPKEPSGSEELEGDVGDPPVEDKLSADEGDETPPEEPTGEDVKDEEGGEKKGEKDDEGRAPVSWKPNAREAWGKIPAEAKAEIERRETEITQALQVTSGARHFTDTFSRMVQPYMPFIAAEGSNPMAAASFLFQTAAGLKVGSPQQKAGIMLELIRDYGVDVNMLDRMLTGEDAGEAQPQDIQAMVDERIRMAQGVGGAQEQAPQEDQQNVYAANQKIETFMADPKNEFFHDVKEAMSALLVDAADRGQLMDIQQAYDAALSIRPDIQKVIAARTPTNGADDAASRRKRAAASIKPGGSSGEVDSAKAGSSVSDDISRAWAAAEER